MGFILSLLCKYFSWQSQEVFSGYIFFLELPLIYLAISIGLYYFLALFTFIEFLSSSHFSGIISNLLNNYLEFFLFLLYLDIYKFAT